jgi:hypothetical protein
MNNENTNQDTNDTEYTQANKVLTEYLALVTDNKHVISTVQGGFTAFMIGRAMAIPPQFSIVAGLVFGAYQSYKTFKAEEETISEEQVL